MLTRDPNFQRVKVGGRGFLWRASYWLGPDHFLVVRIEGFHEKYRRFSYRDIRAIVIRKTRLSLVTNIILGLILVALAIGGLLGEDVALRVVLGISGAAILGALLVNLAKGRSCACYIHTAVQTDRLPSIDRVRKARRLITRLRPKISGAQE